MAHSHITPRTALLTFVTLVAFASNSILCRLALGAGLIGAEMFTGIRLLSGAVTLFVLVVARDRKLPTLNLNVAGALALVAYAAPFSFAYVRIQASVGALILFGAVQATMIGSEFIAGKRLDAMEWIGGSLAIAGLIALTLPGASAPDPIGAGLMATAGISWGVYSLRGRRVSDPLQTTATNFLLSTMFALPLLALGSGSTTPTTMGLTYAVASGAAASGLGYALWYTALRGLTATQAGLVQLLVPVFTAIGGVALLGESITPRIAGSGLIILAGVALAVLRRR